MQKFLRLKHRDLGLLALAALLSLSGYLLASKTYYGLGFPLDDAWIHQTYARNFVAWGKWAFWEGQSSAGSTAPLWSFLLALGYWLRLPYFWWSALLGWLTLLALALLAEYFLRSHSPAYAGALPWMGLLLIFEWHLVWAALSGMETLLYALLVTLVLVLLMRKEINFILLGILVGAGVWIRPDAITLLGPIFFVVVLSKNKVLQMLKAIALFSLSFGAIYALYLLFNWKITGTLYPNTFYAKQAEYAILREILPFGTRWLANFKTPLLGVGALLLPGFVYFVYKNWRKPSISAAAIWFIGYLTVYAVRLPVTYQHGRYLIPAMPIFFLLGTAGVFQFVEMYREKYRLPIFAWLAATALLLFAFWGIGAKAYAQDVAWIETEMVRTAKWTATHLSDDDLVAAHDIGALGYFDGREIVDLAGLVSPEVIPFIRDEAQLANYLSEKGVDYLIVFPTWYKTLPEGLALVYNTKGHVAPLIGGENMMIYQWAH